jgi:hypothetical protein
MQLSRRCKHTGSERFNEVKAKMIQKKGGINEIKKIQQKNID